MAVLMSTLTRPSFKEESTVAERSKESPEISMVPCSPMIRTIRGRLITCGGSVARLTTMAMSIWSSPTRVPVAATRHRSVVMEASGVLESVADGA